MHLARAGLALLAVLATATATAAGAQPLDARGRADGGAEVGALQPPPLPPLERAVPELIPPLPPPPQAPQPEPAPLARPVLMLDGHPREGGFLSGPGSATFIIHHTLMTGLSGLATQMVPRALAYDPATFTDEGARIAYLAAGLGGAAIGFGLASVWQYTHWMGEVTANTGIVTSFFGGMLVGGLTDLFTTDTNALVWMTAAGNVLGGWLLAMIGGGDLSPSRSALILTGGLWAALYTAAVMAVLATTGGNVGTLRAIGDVIMITPALGALAMGLASLSFNPSAAQVMRANLFGLAAGAVLLLLPALVLSAHFLSPVPYILGGAGALATQTLVSLLWAEPAEPEPSLGPGGSSSPRARVSPWW